MNQDLRPVESATDIALIDVLRAGTRSTRSARLDIGGRADRALSEAVARHGVLGAQHLATAAAKLSGTLWQRRRPGPPTVREVLADLGSAPTPMGQALGTALQQILGVWYAHVRGQGSVRAAVAVTDAGFAAFHRDYQPGGTSFLFGELCWLNCQLISEDAAATGQRPEDVLDRLLLLRREAVLSE
ncbi:hypothetical protein ACXZ65_34585 [Streptomyces aculeolatus]